MCLIPRRRNLFNINNDVDNYNNSIKHNSVNNNNNNDNNSSNLLRMSTGWIRMSLWSPMYSAKIRLRRKISMFRPVGWSQLSSSGGYQTFSPSLSVGTDHPRRTRSCVPGTLNLIAGFPRCRRGLHSCEIWKLWAPEPAIWPFVNFDKTLFYSLLVTVFPSFLVRK